MKSLGRVREVTRLPDFRRLVGAQALAQAGDGSAQAGFAVVLVLEPLAEHTPGRILAVFALTLLPYSIVSPFMGVLVDRFDRRSLLVGTNLVRAALIASLPAWDDVLSGSAPLLAAALVTLGLGRLFLTTKGALIPLVLGERRLLSGNAISGGSGMVAALLGAIVGIALTGVFSVAAAFVFAGLLYLGSAWIAARLSLPSTPRRTHGSAMAEVLHMGAELVVGVRAIGKHRGASLPLGALFLVRTAAMIIAIAAILEIKSRYPLAASGGQLGLSAVALGAAGIGAFVGSISAPAVGRRLHRGGLITAGLAIVGISLTGLGPSLNAAGILIATFAGGFGGFLAKVAVDAAVQDALPDNLRGRAFALYDILYNLGSVAAGAIVVVGSPLGTRTTLVTAGVVTLILTIPVASALGRAGLFSDASGLAPPAKSNA